MLGAGLDCAGEQHFKIASKNQYEFNGRAVEISIIDRRGKVLWRSHRSDAHAEPLRWNGRDMQGLDIEVGSYTFKIVYPGHCSVYLPFVLIR